MISKKQFIHDVKDCVIEKYGVAFTLDDIQSILDGAKDAIYRGMKNDGQVKAFDGITFMTVEVPEHTAHNPATGEEVQVPAKKRAKVKFGTHLKDYINS